MVMLAIQINFEISNPNEPGPKIFDTKRIDFKIRDLKLPF
jgi:hypothetical protein